MTLILSSGILKELQHKAALAFPQEICGLLLGNRLTVTNHKSADNIAQNPGRHFEIDPAVLIAAERAMREGGDMIIGYYHSHPTGDVRPSLNDAQNAAPDGRIWLILNETDALAWQAVESGKIHDRFNPLPIKCT